MTERKNPIHKVTPGEDWLPVPGFEGRYEVSDLGRVASYVCGHRKVLSPKIGKNKRPCVGLRRSEGAKKEFFFTYRLMLMAFVGPCPEGMEACHWDGNVGNNILDNLRWGTKADNVSDRKRHGTMIGKKAGIKHHGAKLWDEAIRVIRAEPQAQGTLAMLARAFGVSTDQIRDIRSGRYWRHVPQLV